jgi:molybdenum cofactor synthesis domain-containing protein
MIRVAVLTSSDKGAAGERIDESGSLIMKLIEKIDGKVIDYIVVPDERKIISETLIRMSDSLGADLILTTGGTGLSPRDITPEATLDVIDRQAPGFTEAMRHKSLEITSRAMLSRAVSGTRGRTLIINLPGSPKAVGECLETILPVLTHAIQILKGEAGECAAERKDEKDGCK